MLLNDLLRHSKTALISCCTMTEMTCVLKGILKYILIIILTFYIKTNRSVLRDDFSGFIA